MSNIPTILTGLPVHFHGVDDETPDGCSLFTTTVLDVFTTYVLRDGRIIGRIEVVGNTQNGYAGSSLKGGRSLGSDTTAALGRQILNADRHEQQIRALDAGQPERARNFPRGERG